MVVFHQVIVGKDFATILLAAVLLFVLHAYQRTECVVSYRARR